jgi:hypothetical protein
MCSEAAHTQNANSSRIIYMLNMNIRIVSPPAIDRQGEREGRFCNKSDMEGQNHHWGRWGAGWVERVFWEEFVLE